MTSMKKSFSSLLTVWTKNIEKAEDKKKFEEALRNDTLILGRLREILQEKNKLAENQEISPKLFDDPNWAYKQAYINGYKQGMKQVDDLLKFLPE